MDESCSSNHLAGFITEPHELDHGGKFHIPFVSSLAKTGAFIISFLIWGVSIDLSDGAETRHFVMIPLHACLFLFFFPSFLSFVAYRIGSSAFFCGDGQNGSEYHLSDLTRTSD